MTTAGSQLPSFLRIGERYELGERVGTGTFGVVYRATDTLAEREVAIKLFKTDTGEHPSRIWREAAVLRRLNLPGVVGLLDEGCEDGCGYLVMPFVEGEHFPGPAERWSTNRSAIITSLIELLLCVHGAGIVHGDLKPQNVLVDGNGQVTLLDFGTGSWLSGSSSERRSYGSAGTRAYMAPEQLRGGSATIYSDYYALGVMVYQVLTGRFPHPIGSLMDLVRARLHGPPVTLDAEAAGVSPRLARAVEGLLAMEPQRRRRHLADLVDALEGEPSASATLHQPAYLELLEGAGGEGEREPLSAKQLEAFFDGPEPIFRLRSEAARQLWRRTEGEPQAVVRQIEAWVRHGLAHFRGDRVVVPPTNLERLRRGFHLQPAVTASADADADLEQVHRRLADALEPGEPGRLMHLLRAGEDQEVVAEARWAAAYHDGRGEIGLAIAALNEATKVCRELDDADATYAVLVDWAKVALSAQETSRLEELLYAIEDAIDRDVPGLEPLRRLTDAARVACQRVDDDVFETLSSIAPFDDQVLELRRQMYRVSVAFRHSIERVEEVVDEVDRWVGRDKPGRDARGSLTGWRGLIAYQRGEFERAAELHRRAAEIKERQSSRLASRISAACASMDGLDYEAALEQAHVALEQAQKLRDHRDLAYCHYLERSLRYRLGEPLEPADELHEALELLGSSALSSMNRMIDAVDAFREGHRALAAQYARQVCAAFEKASNRRGEALMRALAIRCEDEVDLDEARRLAAYAPACSAPRIGVQILGLLLDARTPRRPEWVDALLDLASTIPDEQWHKRLEVLSVAEAVELGTGAP